MKIVNPHESPGDLHGVCGGHDELLKSRCTCPDPVLTLSIRASTLHVVARRWTCDCCKLPIDRTTR